MLEILRYHGPLATPMVTKKNENVRRVLTWCSIWQRARNNARPPDTAELR